MDMFSGMGRPMMRLVEKHLLVWFGNLFPDGGLWKILALVLFVVLAAATLAGIVCLLLVLHSRDENVRKVTIPFKVPCWIAGVMFGIMSLVDPDGVWNVIWHVVYAIGFFAIIGMLHIRIGEISDASRGKGFYWCMGLTFMLEMFLVGFYAFTVFWMAILVSIIIIVGVVVAGGGLKGLTMPTRAGGGVDGRRRATLEDGTELVENGTRWDAVNGVGSYHQNADGSFSKD